jgi:hypothetical protein
MAQGWISLHRRIWDSWVWDDKPFSRGQAWADLLLLANHKDKSTPIGKELVLVKRGSHITSQVKLMKRWGWGKEKLLNFIKLLEADDMVKVQTTTRYTLIEITNYNTYQRQTDENPVIPTDADDEATENRPNSDRTQTDGRPNSDRTPTTNNNANNAFNDNNTSSTTDAAIGFMNAVGGYYSELTGRLTSPKDEVAISELANHTQDIQAVKDIMKGISDRYKPVRQGDKIKAFTYFVPGIMDKLFAEQKQKEVKPQYGQNRTSRISSGQTDYSAYD